MSKDNKTHQRIVDVAFQLFAEHGIEKTSLTMIATEVGITKPAIYYHFAFRGTSYRNWVEAIAERGIEFGVVTPDRVVANAHILALVVDNISNYMLMGIELDQRDIWTETVRSVRK
ncbi:TetR family transcriptional regulator [Brevibacillus sp. IT-7CA2]|uniref:TetR family transcriptional regulator n=1 Tax=Brevibacillus sp. IT-7CA2 TaxID=3026436 RepID=UPI0039E063C4